MIKKILADKDTLGEILSKGGMSFVLRMFGMALSFISMWVMTNFYGDSVYGMFSLALTILQITGVFFGLGLPNAFIGFTGSFNDHNQSKGLFLKSAKLALLSSILPIAVFTIGAGFIAQHIFDKDNLSNYIFIVALGTPCMIVHEILCYYFMSVKKIIIYGLSIFILPNVFFILSVLLLHYYNAAGYLTFLAYVLSWLATICIGLIIIFSDRAKIVYPELGGRDILKKSFPMMMSGIFLLLLNWTDMLMLGRFVDAGSIGIYNAAFRIGYLVLFFVVSMNVVIMPKISELYHQRKNDEMKKVVNRSTQVVIALTLPLALVLIFFSKFILGLNGDEFEAGSTTLILITLGGLYNAMTGNVDQILNMTNNQKMVSIIYFGGFLLNVGINFYLIPAYGIEGAAGASLISNVFVNTIFVIYIKRKLGFYTFI
jgi:O-antigen/teichoic acid export membrane protein